MESEHTTAQDAQEEPGVYHGSWEGQQHPRLHYQEQSL